MLPRERGKQVVASGSEGIDAVPDGVLEHILGFLPATCVLARRWRNLWKFATGLRVRCTVDPLDCRESLHKRQEVIDRLLFLRGGAPLETFELVFCHLSDKDYRARLNRWVQHAVMCLVRMHKIEDIWCNSGLARQVLDSKYLTSVEIIAIHLDGHFSDPSSCPSLQHLDLVDCTIWRAEKIASESLKRLSIRNCALNTICGTLICVPSLVSLRLNGCFSSALLFQSMPLLQEAFVHISYQGRSYPYTYGCSSQYKLPEHLSQVQNIALISGSNVYMFNMDFKKNPTFSKLKSLLLNKCWCVAPDFHALDCILKHSPLLQKLSLELYSGPNHELCMKGSVRSEFSAEVLGHLKIVEVKCKVADSTVFKLLNYLGTLGIRKRITSDSYIHHAFVVLFHKGHTQTI